MRRSIALAVLSLVLPSCFAADFGDRPVRPAASYPKLVQEAQGLIAKKSYDEAGKLLEEAARQNPVNGDVWSFLAQNYYNLKRWQPSIDAYQKAIALGDGYKWASAYNIACCYSLWGKRKESLDWLQKAMDMGWRNLDDMRTDSDLEPLRKDPKFIEMAATKDTSKMSRNEGWRYDLWLLDRELRRKHYSPYWKHPKAEFDAYVKKLNADIPKLTDDQITLGFMKLAVMCGDGHTALRPPHDKLKVAPIQLYWFDDGMYVTATSPKYKELAGAKLLQLAGRDWQSYVETLRPYINCDNEMGIKSIFPRYICVPKYLNALGITKDAAKAEYTFEMPDGSRKTVSVEAELAAPGADWATARAGTKNPEPLTMKNRDKPFWFEYLPDRKMVFFQYNAVRNDANETTAQLGAKLEKFIAENEVNSLVIDVRWNGGGNTFLNMPLLAAIGRMTKVNQPGHLFVITGRQTFSACQNFSTDLEMRSNAMFVGEPTGSSPNFIGETVMLTLPYSKMRASVSDLFWGRGWPMDYRTWIAPSLYAPPVFSLYKDNRDPAMEAIFEYLNSGS